MNPKKKQWKHQDKGLSNLLFTFAFIFLLVCILIIFISQIIANVLWFQEVGYLSTFLTQVLTKLSLGLSTLLISGLFLWGNYIIAQKQIKQQRYGRWIISSC